MRLRKLSLADAPLMLQWMHDENVVHHLGTDFSQKTLEDCVGFIEYANIAEKDLHLAIVNDTDEYMGTVSLKHIQNGMAEFAITVRACAMGQGFSRFGMAAILEKGIKELGLTAIYWCVSKHNARAVRFYDKNNYQRTQQVPVDILSAYTQEQQENFIWYIYAG